MMRVFKSAHITELLSNEELQQLVADFKQYKNTGVPPARFGRDALFDHPHTLPSVLAERIMHIHVDDGEQNWDQRNSQYSRTSDYHLIYCQGFNDSECFLLMTILSPDAHAQERNNNIMSNLARMAEKFRQQF